MAEVEAGGGTPGDEAAGLPPKKAGPAAGTPRGYQQWGRDGGGGGRGERRGRGQGQRDPKRGTGISGPRGGRRAPPGGKCRST